MEYEDRWHVIEKLDEGGQGKVYRVLDGHEFDVEKKIRPALLKAIREMGGLEYYIERAKKDFESVRKAKNAARNALEPFRKAVVDLIRMTDPNNQGALKVLHEPKEARDPERAEARVKREIEAMSKISHPNLLKILDYDVDSEWFVSEFHPKGTLIDNKDRFTGNFVGSLRAFRPLVEGVSTLHKEGYIHRDIKPQNVFLNSNNNLVLGDFGLVFFTDEQHIRISETYANVGSRDWMATWAMGIRIEEIKPTFDVFSLGKLLWAMVSKVPILQLWYFEIPKFNLEQMFPDAPYVNLVNVLFKKCIVEYEKDCLPNATALLEEVDKTLSIIDKNADLIGENIERPCKVCGIGDYEQIVDRNDLDGLEDFGFNRVSDQSFKILTCNHCGHVQLFSFRGRKTPPAWAK